MNKKSKVVVLPCEAYEEEKIYNLLKDGLKECSCTVKKQATENKR